MSIQSKSIRIGIVGAGNTTVTRHIPGFRAIDGVEVVGVVNRSRESGERVARQFDIPRVYDDWTGLMSDPDVDAVFVGTWPYMHRTLVVQALEHDKHVLTQARMANTAAEAREMLEVSLRKPHLVSQVWPASILSPDVMEKVVTMVGDGSIGELLSADFAGRTGFADADAPFTWRHDPDLSGFNVLLLGGRYENLMRILGPATSVTAVTRVFCPMLADGAGGRRPTTLPDHIEVIAELAAGGLLHISLSSVAGLAPPSELWVFGTEGTLRCVLDPIGQIWWGRRGDAELSLVEVPQVSEGGIETEREFIGAIRGEGPVGDTTFHDGVRYMEFTEAVIRSAQERRTIALPL